MSDRYIPIDEEGYFVFDGRRVDDDNLGQEMIQNLRAPSEDRGRLTTTLMGNEAFVEAFDAPLIAKHVKLSSRPGFGVLDLPYHSQLEFQFTSLNVDEWDRFHGVTEKEIPFVLSRQAQIEFFEMLDSFDDESVTIKGKRYATPPWLPVMPEINKDDFWTKIYRTEKPGWELDAESVVLPSVLPQLKLNRGRVLVLGCGSGNDAAYFARQGFIVTAVDFSEEAITLAKQKYESVENLTFLRSDFFKLPANLAGRFDLIFEHTCYCAVSPDRRKELVGVWKRALTPQGDLLGVFFATEKRVGPPFGGSEWELRERLKGSFDFLFWTRWRQSVERRKGRELVIFAKRK